MSIGVIITMASITIGSAITQAILNGSGKMDEAKFMDIATKAGLGATAVAIFGSFIKSVRSLG